MSTIQIHQFPTIPQAPADADVLAIEVNGITYKVSKAVLASAIIAQLGGDPVKVAHGGTGSSSASGARTNLSVYSKTETDSAIQQSTAGKALSIVLGSNRTTWADVYEILDKLPTYRAAVFHCDSTPARIISNNNSAISGSSLRGVVARGATGEFKFMCMATTGATMFAWSITNANTTPTFGSMYRYSGTVVT